MRDTLQLRAVEADERGAYKRLMRRAFERTVTELFGAPDAGPVPDERDIDRAAAQGAHLWHTKQADTAWTFYSSRPKRTAWGWAGGLGNASRQTIRAHASGNCTPLVLKSAISIFISMCADSMRSNISTRGTPTRTRPQICGTRNFSALKKSEQTAARRRRV